MDEVIVGTYEGFLLGYSIACGFEGNKLSQTFATHSHTSSVRCVDISGRFLASGGTDDKIVVIDMKTRKEHTVLMHHDGTINSLAFTRSGTHLLSGSSDGSIYVVRTGNWQIEKKWKKAHGGTAVNSIAVHPTDKLALSVGGDKTLRTWNLVKGRPAFTINMSSKGVNMATDVAFSPGGDRFSLISQQTVDIWTIAKAGIEKRITCNSKPSIVEWISDEVIAVGLENGNILTIKISDTEALTCKAHKDRVKCIYYLNHALYSASSSGELKMWHLSDTNCLTEQCVASTGGRITCMTLNQPSIFIKKEAEDEEKKEEEETPAPSEVLSDEQDDQHDEEPVPKKKPTKGAFVTIQYDDDEKVQSPSKKVKRRKKPFKKRQ